MKKRLNWDNPKDCESIITALKGNEIIIGTSDTVIGLFAQAHEQTYSTLNAIKKRSEKPYLLFVNLAIAEKFLFETNSSENIKKLAKNFWPGPLTLIVRAGKSVPFYLKSSKDTIAFRVPNHEGIQEVLKEVPMLFSTSANITEEPIPVTLKDINPEIVEQCSYIVGGQVSSQRGLPSTIVDCSGKKCVVLREGAISKSDIYEVLKK